jgi:hypothetical protein
MSTPAPPLDVGMRRKAEGHRSMEPGNDRAGMAPQVAKPRITASRREDRRWSINKTDQNLLDYIASIAYSLTIHGSELLTANRQRRDF